jgi:hypothetical protein
MVIFVYIILWAVWVFYTFSQPRNSIKDRNALTIAIAIAVLSIITNFLTMILGAIPLIVVLVRKKSGNDKPSFR